MDGEYNVLPPLVSGSSTSDITSWLREDWKDHCMSLNVSDILSLFAFSDYLSSLFGGGGGGGGGGSLDLNEQFICMCVLL